MITITEYCPRCKVKYFQREYDTITVMQLASVTTGLCRICLNKNTLDTYYTIVIPNVSGYTINKRIR